MDGVLLTMTMKPDRVEVQPEELPDIGFATHPVAVNIPLLEIPEPEIRLKEIINRLQVEEPVIKLRQVLGHLEQEQKPIKLETIINVLEQHEETAEFAQILSMLPEEEKEDLMLALESPGFEYLGSLPVEDEKVWQDLIDKYSY